MFRLESFSGWTHAAAIIGTIQQNEDLKRDREAFIKALALDIPEHLPNFERVKRTNGGQESVPDDELSDLELGPNNCAAE